MSQEERQLLLNAWAWITSGGNALNMKTSTTHIYLSMSMSQDIPAVDYKHAFKLAMQHALVGLLGCDGMDWGLIDGVLKSTLYICPLVKQNGTRTCPT